MALTVTDGNASPNYNSIAGNQGGDIFNGGQLTLQNDVVTNGFSIGTVGGPIGRGGAIYNAEGQGNTKLPLDNTIVEDSLARGPNVVDRSHTSGYLTGPSGGDGGNGQGGGIFNDASATLIVEDGSQITNNTALGGNGGHAGFAYQPTAKSARGGNGGDGGNGGFAQGGGIYNAGSLLIVGTNLISIPLSDNVAQGGDGGVGNFGTNGVNDVRGGIGGNGGDGGSGGFADGGGIYNSGTVSFPSQMTINYVNFQGDQALGGTGDTAGVAGNGGNGSKSSKGGGGIGGTGGYGGVGGNGGDAQGGGIFTGFGALSVSNSQFGLDATGVSDQAIGGDGGQGNVSGKGGTSNGFKVVRSIGIGDPGGIGPAGGAGGDAGFAKSNTREMSFGVCRREARAAMPALPRAERWPT